MVAGKNLTENDIQEIKKAYFIPQGDKPLYKQDFEFIVSYVNSLYAVLENFWKAEHSGQEEDYSIAIQSSIKLAQVLEEYMKTAEAGNIMRRIIFIENIDREFSGAQISMPWLLRTYPTETYKKTEPISKDLALFYKYVCVNALMEDGFLEKRENESAQIIADRLKATVETDFIKRIDKNRLCYSDIFYLMGHYKKEIVKLKEKEQQLEQEKCAGCKRDDCMSTHCSIMAQKIEISGDIKKLDLVRKACVSKAFGEEISQETRVKIAKSTPESWLRQIVCGILDMDTNSASLQKRIMIDWGRERNICIQPSKVQEVLAQSISTLKGVDYWRTRDIATGIVLNDYDLSRGTGDDVHQTFTQRYEQTNREVRDNLQQINLSKVNVKKLIEQYKNQKSNNEELGGE